MKQLMHTFLRLRTMARLGGDSLPLVLHLLKGTELIETSVSIQIMTFKPGQIRSDISELCN